MKAKTLVATLMGVLSFAAMAGELDNTPSTSSIARPAGVEAAPVGGVLVKRDANGKIIEAYKVPMTVTEANQAQALVEITSNPENNITAKLTQTPKTQSELDQDSSASASWYIGVGWGGYGYGIGYGYGWGGYYGGYYGGYGYGSYCGYGYGYGCGYGYGGYWGGYYPHYRPYGGCWGWYY